jgi:hypothetical protein
MPEVGERGLIDVRFSNRPIRVERFQTIHHCSVDVARALAMLGPQSLIEAIRV